MTLVEFEDVAVGFLSISLYELYGWVLRRFLGRDLGWAKIDTQKAKR